MPPRLLLAIDLDTSAWTWWVWLLYCLGALYLVGFFVFWFRARAAERRARSGDVEAVRQYNRLLRGFPNGFYAKNLGKRKLDVAPERKE